MERMSAKVAGATEVKVRSAEVAGHLKIMGILESAAQKHAKKEHYILGRRRYRKRITKLLKEYYMASLSSNDEQQVFPAPSYENETPQKTAKILYEQTTAKQLLDKVVSSPQLGMVEAEIFKSHELTRAKRGEIAANAILQVKRLHPKQREKVPELLGYTQKEAKVIGKKVGTSVLLDIITTGIALAGVAAATAYEKASQIIHNGRVAELALQAD